MNALYRLSGKSTWVEVIALKWYAPFYFVLAWDERRQDFQELWVQASFIRFEDDA